MKRISALLMCIILIFTFAACGKEESSSTPSPVKDSFKPPEKYAAVLYVKLKPEIKIYINTEYRAVAVNYINKAAEEIAPKVYFKNQDVGEVVRLILMVSRDNGYISERTSVFYDVTEIKDGMLAETVLDKATDATSDIAMEFKISFSVQTDTSAAKNNTSSEESADSTVSSESTESVFSEIVSSNPTSSDDPNHKHIYGKPNCTSPAACVCGATTGAALGHSFESSNCNTPAICTRCGYTDGKTAAHSYLNGTCTNCGISKYLSIKEIDPSKDYIGNYSVKDGNLIGYGINLCGEIPAGEIQVILLTRLYNSTQTDQSQTAALFAGKTYYSAGFFASKYIATAFNKELTVKNQNGKDMIKFTLQRDGLLLVTESQNRDFPAGMLLSPEKDEFLTKS